MNAISFLTTSPVSKSVTDAPPGVTPAPAHSYVQMSSVLKDSTEYCMGELLDSVETADLSEVYWHEEDIYLYIDQEHLDGNDSRVNTSPQKHHQVE